MIGIIVADSNEITEFPFDIKKEIKINQFNFTVFSNDVVFVHSGIGIINAASATQEMISSFKIKEVWNYGAVGANKHLNVYDVVTPSKIFLHDAITPWYKRGQTPNEKEYFKNAISSDKNNNLGSGSSFVVKKETVNELKNELDIDIFDMETAAIAQVADKNNIPIKVIKVVSDSIGHTDASLVDDINTRIKKAGIIAFNIMLKTMEDKN